MDKLPDEIVCKIFHYLNSLTKLICCQVSKRFLLISDKCLKSQRSINFNDCLLSLRNITSFNLAAFGSFLQNVIGKCPKIDKITLNVKPDDHLSLVQLATAYPHVIELFISIDNTTLLDIDSIGKFSSVTWFELSILNVSCNIEQSILNATARWKNLERFHLSLINVPQNRNFVINLLTSMPDTLHDFQFQLSYKEDWSLSSIEIMSNVLETFIQKHPKLRRFEIDTHYIVLRRTLENLHKLCPSLNEIYLGGYGRDSDFREISTKLSIFHELKYLKFSSYHSCLSASVLSAINCVTDRLTTLSLNAHVFTGFDKSDTMSALMGPLNSLKNLHISYNYGYSKRCRPFHNAEPFFRFLPNLRHISLPANFLCRIFLQYPISRCQFFDEITCSTECTPEDPKYVFELLQDFNKLIAKHRIRRDHVIGAQIICIRLKASWSCFSWITKSLKIYPLNCMYIVNSAI